MNTFKHNHLRFLLTLTLAAVAAASLLPTGGVARGEVIIQCPDPLVKPNARCMSLTAGDGYATMADGRVLYMFGFSDVTGLPADQVMTAGMLAANWAAPTIALDEGDEFYLSLTNVGMLKRPDLFDPHTIHWHGFANAASVFDGVPDSAIAIFMGATLTYYYNVLDPGTYMYHCHVEAIEHMQMGMLGNLYVRPAQNRLPDGTVLGTHIHSNPDWNANRNLDNPLLGDKYVFNDGDGSTRYDVEYVIQLDSFDPVAHDADENIQLLHFDQLKDTYAMINGRGYPDTVNPNPLPGSPQNGGQQTQRISSLITATAGQKILLRISDLNVTRYYTIATTGIPMHVVGLDARQLKGAGGQLMYHDAYRITLGSGETADVILDTTGVAPGTYFLYTPILNYLNNNQDDFGGMMTEIRIQ